MVAESRFARWVLYALFAVCPLLFFTDLTRNPYYTQIALLNILVAVLWLFWLGQAWRANRWEWRQTPLDLPLLALIAWCLISWVYSMVRHPVLIKPIYSEGSRAIIFLFLNTALVYSAAVRLQDRLFMKRLLWLTYAVSVTASIYGIAQYFGIEWVWPKTLNPYGSRPVSTFGNPNFLSSFLVLIIPVMAGDYLFKSTGLPRMILLFGILINTGALLATLTRSSWGGLLLGFVILIVSVSRMESFRKECGKWFMMLLVSLGLTVLLWPKSGTGTYSATVLSRVLEVKNSSDRFYGPVWQRLLIWVSAWNMTQDHPAMGKGWGTFELFYPYYQGRQLFEARFSSRTHANNSHNEVLEYLSQVGVVGLGLVFWLWVVFFRRAWAVQNRLDALWRPLQAGMIGGVAGMLADNLLNVSIHFAVPAFFFWWWVGFALNMGPDSVETRVVSPRPALKAVAALTALLLVAGAARAFAFWRAEINFFEGFKRSKNGADMMGAQKLLERAYAWHHLEVNNNYELGNVYARLNMHDKALAMYGRALDANPGYDEIFFNRGTVLMQSGRDALAIRHYQICLAINPLSREAYNALAGLLLKDRNNADAAEKLYLQGLQVFPNDRDLWNNLGWVLTQQEKWLPAREAYQRALAIDPNFDLAKRNLAVVNEKLQKSLAR